MLASFYFVRSYSRSKKNTSSKVQIKVKNQYDRARRAYRSSTSSQMTNFLTTRKFDDQNDKMTVENMNIDADDDKEIFARRTTKNQNMLEIPDEVDEESPRNPVVYIQSKDSGRDSFSVVMKHSNFTGLSKLQYSNIYNRRIFSSRSSVLVTSPVQQNSPFGLISPVQVRERSDLSTSQINSSRFFFPLSPSRPDQDIHQSTNFSESLTKRGLRHEFRSPISRHGEILFDQNDIDAITPRKASFEL